MGLSVSPNIYQEKMSEIFKDLPQVIVYIDGICGITNGTFHNHLSMLETDFARLQENNLQLNGDKSKFFEFRNRLGYV
jgi:hypothetical protein